MENKKIKFEIGELLGIGMTLVILGIGLAFGLEVLGSVRDESGMADCTNYPPASGFTTFSDGLCANSSGSTMTPVSPQYNGTVDSVSGVAKIPEKLPTIATVIVASVIIGILVTYLWGRFAR